MGAGSALAIVLFDPRPIFTADYMIDPFGMGEIPCNRLAQAAVEGFTRDPAQFALYFTGIDRVALVVTRAIGNKGLLLAVGFSVAPWPQFIQ